MYQASSPVDIGNRDRVNILEQMLHFRKEKMIVENCISLLRIGVDSLQDYHEKISKVKKEHRNIDRFQLCIRSSLLDEAFADEMLSVGRVGSKDILRLEVDDNISLDIMNKIKPAVYQIVIIAGDNECIKNVEGHCKQLKIDCRNFVQERNNILSAQCRVRQKTDVFLTEKKLIEAIRGGISRSENVDAIEGLDDTKEIVLVPVGAGLACQIFLYLFAMRAAQATNRKIILDDSGNYIRNSLAGKDKFVDELMWNYHIDEKQAEKCAEEAYKVISHFQFEGLELRYIFDLKLPLLSEYFSDEDWNSFINAGCEQKYSQVPEIIEKMGYPVSLIRDNVGVEFQNNLISLVYETNFKDVYLDNSDDFEKLKKLLDGNIHNVYLSVLATSGDINDSLFKKRSWVQSILQFPTITGTANEKIYKLIGKTKAAIIHIRRGEKIYSNWILDSGYYATAIRTVENLVQEKLMYYLFSDSMEWCKENEEQLGLTEIKDRLIYVEGNTGKNCFRDMQLMSNGTIMIPSPASNFGMCAVLFGKIEKCVGCKKFVEKGEIHFTEVMEVKDELL